MAELSIATFNTHYGVRPVRRPPVVPYDVGGVLASLDADVVVTQETWRPDAERGAVDQFADDRGLELHFAPTGRTTLAPPWPRLVHRGEGASGIAVITRYPARRLPDIALGPTPGDPSPRRVAMQLELDVEGTRVHLVAVHLTSRLPHGPPAQLRQLSRALPPPGTPVVVAGDCNFWGPPVIALVRGWRRAVTGRTWPGRIPHSQIDHILVRRGDVGVLEGAVFGYVGSDHRPIRARLRV